MDDGIPEDKEESFPCEVDRCSGEITMYIGKYSEFWQCNVCGREYREPTTADVGAIMVPPTNDMLIEQIVSEFVVQELIPEWAPFTPDGARQFAKRLITQMRPYLAESPAVQPEEAFEQVKREFADSHAWFQTMCSQKMDGHIAEHFWQAARNHYEPKRESVELEKEKENFSLAANQCHHGYAGEYGHHRCKYQDRIERLRAALQNIMNGIETGLMQIDTPADETWANAIRQAQKALKP